jgi:hypothetical protein
MARPREPYPDFVGLKDKYSPGVIWPLQIVGFFKQKLQTLA